MSRTSFPNGRKFFAVNVSVMSMIVGAALATLVYFACSSGLPSGDRVFAQDTPPSSEGIRALLDMQQSFREVAKKVLPVVVQINVVEMVGQQRSEFYAPPDQPGNPRPGLGSGVLVRKEGRRVYVLTNDHVVAGAQDIKVLLYDRREFSAQRVGTDPRKDLALVVFETSEEVPVAELGDSAALQVGDWVLAVGNPFGFTSSITLGIVSALGREAAPGLNARYTDFIQTDAAINQGNSGGALVNLFGQVVGINSWIATDTGGSAGVGFSIPINNAKQAIDDFITKGRVDYGWLGVVINEPTDEMVTDMKIGDAQGAFVFDVFQESPADKSGIYPGDLITEVAGQAVKSSDELLLAVGKLRPGDTVQFGIIRYGERIDRTAKIAVRQPDERVEEQRAGLWPGFTVLVPTAELRAEFKIPARAAGVFVDDVQSGTSAEKAGLRKSDLIVRVADQDTGSLLEFYRALNEATGRAVPIDVYRGGADAGSDARSEMRLTLIR